MFTRYSHDIRTIFTAYFDGVPCHGTSLEARPIRSVRIRPASRSRPIAALRVAFEILAAFASFSSANLAGA